MPRALHQQEGVLNAKVQRAIEHYVDCRDIDRAEELAGMEKGDFARAFKRSEVQEIINRKIEAVDQAVAIARANARTLTVDHLDEKLVEAIDAGIKKGDVKAIELGYERIGMRRDGNFMTQAQSSEQTRPMVYRVLEQTVTRTEQYTQRQIESPVEEIPALPAPKSAPILDVEIEDY